MKQAVIFEGRNTTVLQVVGTDTHIVKHGVNKTARKVFYGESAWSDAQRFCWDRGDLSCNL